MSDTTARFKQEYLATFLDYVASGGDEAGLLRAFDYGRRALAAGISLVQLTTIHHEVLFESSLGPALEAQATHLAELSQEFFAHSLAAFDMAERGYKDAIDKLRTLNERLEQRVAERTVDLQRQTHLLETVVECMSDGLAVANENGEFLLWNAAATETAGIGATDAPPAQWSEHYGIFLADGKTPHPSEQLPLVRAIRGERVDETELFIRNPQRPDGLWVGASARPLRDPTGALKGGVAVFRDVTESKRAHAQAAELAVARSIQQGLFPQAVPSIPGFNIAGACEPAHATGGDYFDYFLMRNGSLGIVIADACGHGFGPALLMAETRAYLRALARTHADLGDILAILNQNLLDDTASTDHFVTLLLLQLDVGSRSLVYCGAGHPPGYILDRSGAVRSELVSAGPPLGILGDCSFSVSSPIALERGELVLLLTDGILEATAPDGTPFRLSRALDVVRAHRHQPAREILSALLASVHEFGQHRALRDDISAIIIKSEEAG